MIDTHHKDDHQEPTWLRFAQHRWTVPVLVALMTLSLLLHLLTLTSLIRIRSLARERVSALAAQVEQARNDTLTIDFKLNQPIPLRLAIPVYQELIVPISTTVTLNQQLQVNTPLGQLPLPINAELPVNLSVPVTISETIPISTSINLEQTLPVAISVRETSLAGYLERLQRDLIALSEEL